MRLSPYPCGFFCRECLMRLVHESGTLNRIFWHIIPVHETVYDYKSGRRKGDA